MAKAKVIAFTEFRYQDKKFIPINLVFVRKDFEIINIVSSIYNRSFDNLKEYMDFILAIASNNNLSIGHVSQFGCKFYNIMFRNAGDDEDGYSKLAYPEA